jgi:hypothetical protein
MAAPAMWSQNPAIAPPTAIELLPGWNSVCYAGEGAHVAALLASAAGEARLVYALGTDRTWARFVPDRPELSNLEHLDRFDCVLVQMAGEHAVTWAFDV